MAQRRQRGWLKKESRTSGDTWVLFFRKTRKSDGKRIENKVPIGLVKDLPEKDQAWAEVEKLHLGINEVDSRRGITFGDLAQHYAEHELVNNTESIHAKAHTTVRAYERVLRNRLLPQWGNRIALGIEPLEVEQWLKDLKRENKFANPTLDKTRRVMSLICRHGRRIRTDFSKPGIEPDALRSLQDHQRVRSDDSHSGAGVRGTAQLARAGAYAYAWSLGHGSPHIRMLGLAMARRHVPSGNLIIFRSR